MNDIKNCIVGVLVDGKLRGTGYVATQNLVITCAHVLTKKAAPPKDGVSVRFHCNGEEYPVKASAEWWSVSDKNDIAALVLSKPLPAGVEVARLAKSAGRKNHECEVFGYPDVGQVNGLGGHAKVIEYVNEFDGRQLVQLESTSATCGYSGSPLLDSETCEVIGTIVEIADQARARYASHLHARLEDLAFATPLEVLAELIPDLPVDSDDDLDVGEKALAQVRAGIQQILSDHSAATDYLAKQIVGLETAKDVSQQITDHLLNSSLRDFLPLAIGGFTDHAGTDSNVAKAFRDLATYVLPQIYNIDLVRHIRRQLNSGDNFLAIPTPHRSLIELVLAGVKGRKLGFPDNWPPLDDIPSAHDEIAQCADFGIMEGENRDKFIESFEHAIMQKSRVGGIVRGLRNQTKAINQILGKLGEEKPPVVYYFIYPDGQSRVEELETSYPHVVFIAHQWTDHDEEELGLLFDLRRMFCSESNQ